MFSFRKVPKEYAYEFVYNYHYSKVMPVLTKHYICISVGGTDVGIITLGWGTQPLGTIKKIFPNENLTTESYYEIGKMCFLPILNNGNSGSTVMSEFIKYLKTEFPDLLFLYTLADGIMGKAGYIYQASNFRYIGKFDTLVYLDNKTGEKIHPRTAKELCKMNAEFLGKNKVFWLTYDFMEKENISKIQGQMFRYIYPLNKKAKKILDNSYPIFQNPKKEQIKWYKMSEKKKIEIPMPIFNMGIENGFNKKNISRYIAQDFKSQKSLF